MNKQQKKPKNTFIRRPSVEHRTGLSTSSLYELIAKGQFPKPVSINTRSVGWIESEVDAWIEERISRSRVDQIGDAHKQACLDL